MNGHTVGASDISEPRQPNDAGNTSCIVRWMVETSAGWLGAWDREAFDAYVSERVAAERERCARICEDIGDGHPLELVERLREFVALDGGDIADVEAAANEIERLAGMADQFRDALFATAAQLDEWASTHQVEPMRKKAEDLRRTASLRA